jgi:mono/diheme cytochrome c family protein
MRYSRVLRAAVMAIGLISAAASSAIAEGAAQNYQTFCALCHGSGGGGDGPGATTLPIKPRNFTDCERMRRVSDQEAYTVIRNGGAAAKLSAEMPAWKDGFSDQEIHALVRYVESFCKDEQQGGITKVGKR